MKRLLLMFLLVATALVATGCGGEDHDAHGASQGMVPGSAASESESTREIMVEANDDLKFVPETIEVAAGEVVTFVVENTGIVEHEFVLGDKTYQENHESVDHGTSGMRNGVVVSGGETKRLTWRFDEAGEVLYGCHEPGHYKAGMVGTIAVDS
jgi:uncharacterized cupredoxin-like copper-binding protein